MRPYRNKPKASICEMISALNVRPFWVFALLVSCTMFVRMLYRHLDVTFPEYAEREMGENVKLGTIIMSNPASVIIFTILVALFGSHIPVMPAIILGMTIMSLGCACFL